MTPAEWQRLQPVFQKKGTLSAGLVARKTKISRNKITALFYLIGKFKAGSFELAVFHCENAPVAIRPFSDGFQPTPWRCPTCKKQVGNPDDLRYEVQVTIESAIIL